MNPSAVAVAPQQSLRHEVRIITPDEAASYLRSVRNDAAIDHGQVATYAQDMAIGAWKLNGDPIIFDASGVLMSGRLRLHACVRAKQPFPTLIVYDVDPQYFDSIDALRRRRVADIMSIRKEKDGRALAAALMALWRFSNEDFESQSKRASSQGMIAILEQNPDVRYSVAVARSAVPRIPHGLGAALHFLFSRVDANKADSFFSELAQPQLSGKSATALLHKQLEEGVDEGGRRSQVQLAGTIIKAWEAYRLDRPISLIRYARGSEQFPRISGLNGQFRFDGVKHSAEANIRDGADEALSRPLSVRVELITPERARQILERNDLNRSIAGGVVEKYARDMGTGAWALNGQTIKIADSGRLLDGQHRCAAAIRANTSFQAIVVEGLSEDVFDTFDLGTRRSISTILKDRGESNTAVLGAVLRQVWLIENGLLGMRNTPPTVAEILETLERHPQVRESGRLSTKTRDIGSSIILGLHYFFRQVDQAVADEFLDRLSDGARLEPDSAILKLRDIMLEDRANRKRRLSDLEKAALMIKAWNFHYEGRTVRVLKWQTAGPRIEDFPRIAGLPHVSAVAR